jgi:diaminopimelate epimerase
VKLAIMAGTANVFAVVDARHERLPRDLAQWARDLCTAPIAPDAPPQLDGLLVVAQSERAACRMSIFNVDGSRAEACGNGLRCVAKFAHSRGFTASDRLRVETDAGIRDVELLRDNGSIVGARATMGTPRVLGRDIELATSRGPVEATLVDMGNPHCVLFVDDERTAPVEVLGPELERHAHFPKRTNVEFCARRGGKLWLRVWERGVGETLACGTGACATAVAASLLSPPTQLPVDVEVRGGRLNVAWDKVGEVVLSGPCEELWSGEVGEREPVRP